MNGYGDQYGISYRTLHKIFELLHFRKANSVTERRRVQSICGRKRSVTGDNIDSQSSVTERTGSIDVDSTEDADFNNIGENSPANYDFSVSVSMLEIYNEMVRDLLNPVSHEGHGLDIRQTAEGGVGVPGLTSEHVSGIDDVMAVFSRGSSNRATITTNLNEHSSRSHSILMVNVIVRAKDAAPVSGKLYLVDLAGSERIEKSGRLLFNVQFSK